VIISCRFCHQKFSVDQSGDYECPHCRQRQSIDVNAQSSATLDQAAPTLTFDSIPWEQRRQLGFWPAAKETWIRSCMHPVDFFRAFSFPGGFSDALLYGVLVGTIGTFGALIWQSLWGLFQAGLSNVPHSGFSALWIFGSGLVFLLFMPIFLAVGMILNAAIVHFFLLIFKSNRQDFEATFRVVGYAQSPALLNLVPIVGGLVGGVWSLVLVIIGLREVHQISTGRAVAVVFAPMVICCCGIALTASMLFGFLMDQFQF